MKFARTSLWFAALLLWVANLAACLEVTEVEPTQEGPQMIQAGQGGLVEFTSGIRCFGVADGLNQGFVTENCQIRQNDQMVAFLANGLRYPLDAPVARPTRARADMGSRSQGLWACLGNRVCRWVVKKVFEPTPLNEGEDEQVRRRNQDWEQCRDTDRCADPDMDEARRRYQERRDEQQQQQDQQQDPQQQDPEGENNPQPDTVAHNEDSDFDGQNDDVDGDDDNDGLPDELDQDDDNDGFDDNFDTDDQDWGDEDYDGDGLDNDEDLDDDGDGLNDDLDQDDNEDGWNDDADFDADDDGLNDDQDWDDDDDGISDDQDWDDDGDGWGDEQDGDVDGDGVDDNQDWDDDNDGLSDDQDDNWDTSEDDWSDDGGGDEGWGDDGE
jgi:hypothetical protein